MDVQQFKETLRKIFPAELLEDEVDLRKSAQMSEKEVIQIAEEQFKINEDSAHFLSRNISLVEDGENLLWRVRFAPTSDDGLPVKGGHLIVVISDKTKGVLEIFNSPY